MVPQGLILESILFNSFMNDLDDETECTPGNYADDTELGEVADTSGVMLPEGPQGSKEVSQQELHEVQQVKCKILHLGRNKPMQQYTLEPTVWKAD